MDERVYCERCGKALREEDSAAVRASDNGIVCAHCFCAISDSSDFDAAEWEEGFIRCETDGIYVDYN